MLNVLFTAFDELLDDYNVKQVNIIGDAYMAVSESAVNMLNFACAVLDEASKLNVRIRIGISYGPAVSTTIGVVNKARSYYGDTVNMASRMESHGFPNTIHVSETFIHQYADETLWVRLTDFKQLGVREIKGKGNVQTYVYCKAGAWESAFHSDTYKEHHTSYDPSRPQKHSSFTYTGDMNHYKIENTTSNSSSITEPMSIDHK
jgi:class 3 adenylate cyclase